MTLCSEVGSHPWMGTASGVVFLGLAANGVGYF